LENNDWDFTKMPEDWVYIAVFVAPAALLAVSAFIFLLILNPYILGWPFNPPLCRKRADKKEVQKSQRTVLGGQVVNVGLDTFMDKRLDREVNRVANKTDVELGSLATKDFGDTGVMTTADPKDFCARPGDVGQKGRNNNHLTGIPERNNFLQQQRSV
jgi:hypothetical protein